VTRWICFAPLCAASADGEGSAIGLRAIGWYYARGVVVVDALGDEHAAAAITYCPEHHPGRPLLAVAEMQRLQMLIAEHTV
jgi:hypothetical protein